MANRLPQAVADHVTEGDNGSVLGVVRLMCACMYTYVLIVILLEWEWKSDPNLGIKFPEWDPTSLQVSLSICSARERNSSSGSNRDTSPRSRPAGSLVSGRLDRVKPWRRELVLLAWQVRRVSKYTVGLVLIAII